MNRQVNKQDEYKKPYFFFDFDPSLYEEADILDDFYTKKFEEFKKSGHFVHLEIPQDIKTHANTGCLIGRNITSDLRKLTSIFKAKRLYSKRVEQRVTILKNFRYIDGQIRNTNIFIRAVKEQQFDEENSHIFRQDSFCILHFYHEAPRNLLTRIRRIPKLRYTSSEPVVDQISTDICIKKYEPQEKNNQQQQKNYPNDREIEVEEDGDEEEVDQKFFYNSSFNNRNNQISHSSHNNNDNNWSYGNNKFINNNNINNINSNSNNNNRFLRNQKSNIQNNNEFDDQREMDFDYEPSNSQQTEILPQKQKKERGNNTERMKLEMKKEYQELEVEEQKSVAEQEAKYYKNLYIKEQIKNKEQSQRILEIEIKLLKQQLTKSEQQRDEKDDNISLIID